MTKQETYPDGTPLVPGDSLEDNPQGGWPEVTDADIRALLTEASEARDWQQVILCRIALGRDPEPQDAEERLFAWGFRGTSPVRSASG